MELRGGVRMRGLQCGTEGCVDLRGFWCGTEGSGTEGFLVWN